MACWPGTGVAVPEKQVVILSSRGLFREGLKRILAGVAMVFLAASPDELADRLSSQPIDVVILDQENDALPGSDLLAQWLALPGVRIITVRLDAHDMQIYYHQQIIPATPQDLIAAVEEA
jgi:DNA-binding NarL/FixJ family response regulator